MLGLDSVVVCCFRSLRRGKKAICAYMYVCMHAWPGSFRSYFVNTAYRSLSILTRRSRMILVCGVCREVECRLFLQSPFTQAVRSQGPYTLTGESAMYSGKLPECWLKECILGSLVRRDSKSV